jgi:hypothetical protein
MECLFHLQNNDFGSRADYGHQNHFAEKNVDAGFALWKILCLSKISMVLILFF